MDRSTMYWSVWLLAAAVVTVSSMETAVLDPRGNYNISWRYDEETITFTCTVTTQGWVALGFSPNGNMINSDMVIVTGVATGRPEISDRHTGNARAVPTVDTHQDWTLVSYSFNGGRTSVTMSRKRSLCRDGQTEDRDIGEDTVRVLFAYGADNSLRQHTMTARGSKSLYLLVEPTNHPPLPGDAITAEFLNNLTMPSIDTTYWCRLHPMPRLARKHHAVMFEPVIQPGNEQYVHHILFYGCYHQINGSAYIDAGVAAGHCYGGMPNDILQCRGPMYGWAIGGGGLRLPEVAGFPIGGENDPEYVVVETHYDNPNLVSGVRDASGIRMIYSPTTREMDAEMIEIGNVQSIAVPPSVPKADVSFFCSMTCTSEAIPPSGINIYGGLLHAHTAASKLYLRHYRDGQELPTILRDESYDFNYQEFRFFERTVKILPGDTLQMTCTFDTLSRQQLTVGGLSTREEMCLAYLATYPRILLPRCGSQAALHQTPNTATIYTDLSVPNIGPNSRNLQTNFASVNWTADAVRSLEMSYLNDVQYGTCGISSVKPFQAHGEPVPIPEAAKSPPKAPEVCRLAGGARAQTSVALNAMLLSAVGAYLLV